MTGLGKFGSKVEERSEVVGEVAHGPQGQKCPVCGVPVPAGSRYCPQCGTLTDRSPEGLAAFSSGPQYAMMKAQAAAVQDIQAEVASIRRNVQWLTVVITVGGLLLLLFLWFISSRI
jgi:uncharacterized Zn finger protein (UPF0148 family)